MIIILILILIIIKFEEKKYYYKKKGIDLIWKVKLKTIRTWIKHI